MKLHIFLLGMLLFFIDSVALSQKAMKVSQNEKANAQQTNSRLPLKPCRVPNLNEDVLCGVYEVFENRERKTGRKISLNIVILPALSSSPSPDPLFVLVGGPGQAATSGAASDARRFAGIRRERDIVLIDQRGTGKSNGLQCGLGGINGMVESFVAGEFPVEQVKKCREQLESNADLKLYSTPVAMDDLDEVRQWLGYQKINLYGGSYGTRPALVYLRRHPQSVRTITIRGVYSLTPLYFARDTQRSLDLLFDDCAKDAECAKAYPNLRQDFQTIVERLEKSPAQFVKNNPRTGEKLTFTITRNMFIGGVRRLLYDTNSQRRLPLMIKKALAGNFQPFEDVIEQVMGIVDDFSVGMFFSVACPEGFANLTINDIERESKGSFFSGYMARAALNVCKEWTQSKIPNDYYEPIKSDAQVLILSGQLDPVTPPIWGEQAAKHLPNSLHLTMEGIAHSPFPSCAIDIMTRFISAGSTKDLDTSCIKNLKRPAFVLSSTTLPVSYESSNPVERELVNLEHKWLQMVSQADRASLESFLPDEFKQMRLMNWEEDRANKSEWIDRVVQLASGVEGAVFELEKPHVSLYDDTAIVNARWSLKGTANGRAVTNTILIMDVWRKQKGEWRVVTRHIESVTAPKN